MVKGLLKKLFSQLRGYFPSALPKGAKEFDVFIESILETYNLPDMPSYRHAVASMIMHLGPQTSTKSKIFFARSIRKAMSNQVAYEKIQELKDAEIAKAKQEQLKADEVTAAVESPIEPRPAELAS